MNPHETTRARLLEHYRAYPLMEITDLFKYLFQSAWGCEHMVPSEAVAMDMLRKEQTSCAPSPFLTTTPLDGAYSRVHLSSPDEGVSPETLGKLFLRSARKAGEGETALIPKLRIARDMICDGSLPFKLSEFDREEAQWRAIGYPAVHHSDTFRRAYRPAYRVLANGYVTLLPFLAKIEEGLRRHPPHDARPFIVAIEGGSASGKTTLAKLLGELYDCTVFHMDDFFLRPEQRTPERRAEIGGNVDRERFLEEVLLPLRKGAPVEYRRFDCATQTVASPVSVRPKPLTILEGAYSMHPDLSHCYDLSAFVEISPACQRERIRKRNPSPWAERFFDEWIPLEQAYFMGMNVQGRCDLSLSAEDL